jgi:WD40 repeat protein
MAIWPVIESRQEDDLAWSPVCAFEYDVFIVHASVDEPFVQGYLIPELGLATERVLVPRQLRVGQSIIEEIERGIRTSRVTITVLSPAYMSERWAMFGEQLAAYTHVTDQNRSKVIPLLRTDCDLPTHIRSLVTLDFRDSNPEIWRAETARLRTYLAQPAVTEPDLPCPYPGMRPFTEHDASRFFGRDAEMNDLIGRLQRGEREIYIIGPSGSGKSSLVAAGLVPRLTNPAGTGGFLVRTMRPGERPFSRLIHVLECEPTTPAVAIKKLLARLAPPASMLLVIDQLEELFTVSAAGERVAFLETVRALRVDPQCVLVFTLRADFFGAFMDSALWTDLDGRISRLEIGALRSDSLRAVIERPARDLGVYLEPDLIERLLADTALEPGALPLLQEALVHLWDRRRRRLLTLADYQTMGDGNRSGLALAISDRADTTLRTLTRTQETIALRILLRLVNLGEGRVDTRRQQPCASLRSTDEEPADFDAALQRLVDDRLVTVTSNDNRDAVRVDMAHEVLIHAWPTFAAWIKAWRSYEQRRRELEAAAVAWRARGSGEGGLLDRVEHAEAIVWRTEALRQLGESADMAAFIAASKATHARAQQQQRRRVQVALTVLALFVVATSILALVARTQRVHAQDALASAEQRKRELVLIQAETALSRDPTAALAWLKTYNIGTDDADKVVDVVDEALALGVARHVFRPGDWVSDAQFTPDGTTLVAAVRDGGIRAYDVRTGFENELGKAPSAPEALVLSPDGEFAITGGARGEVIAWPLRGGASRMLLAGGGRTVTQLRVSLDGRVLVEHDSSAPQVVPLDGGEPALLVPASALKFVIADDDWSRVVLMTSGNELAVPERGSADGVRLLAHTDKAIMFLAISPRGDTVLIHDGTTIWSLPFTGGALREVTRYRERLTSVAWSPDGQTIALGGHRPEIVLVNTATGAVTELRGHTDAIYTLAFSHDGTQLLSASDDATARVWRLANRTAIVLRGHDDDVTRARFSADERSVATSSVDGSTRVWAIDRASDQTLVEGEPIDGMRLDGDRVMVWTGTAIARWDLASGQREPLFSWADEPHHLGYGVASYDGEHAVFPNADGSMELRARTGPSILLRGHRGLITRVGFTRDNRTLFSTSSDGTLRRWDVATGEGTILLEGTTPLRGLAIARDGRVAVQASDLAYLADAAGKVTTLGKGSAWCFDGIEFELVTDRLVARRCDRSLAIIDGARAIELPTDGNQVSRIAVSPDGRRIAGGLSDRTVRIWDARSGEVLDTLRGHTDFVYDVAFSPDGRKLASASYDKTIRLWDLSTKRYRILRGHTESVNRVAWRGTNQLVTGSQDGTIRLWKVPSFALPSSADIIHQLNAATTARIDHDRPISGNSHER